MEMTRVAQILETMSKMMNLEVAIAIADSHKWIYYQPGRAIDLKIKPGDSIPEGALTLKALENKREISDHVDRGVYGVPYYATSIPLVEEDRIEGCITAIYPDQKLRHTFLIGKKEDRWIPIPFEEIYYISSNEGKTHLHTAQGILQNKYSLSELERILPAETFIRCHRAFIVNIHSIREIQPDFHSTFLLTIKSEQAESVPVSQKYAHAFRQFLGF